MPSNSKYLGDAVYAKFENGMIGLTLNHHEAEPLIWLDASVTGALLDYINKDIGFTRVSELIGFKNPSVAPDWFLSLPLQQQSVLFLGARGPDGVYKNHPCKDVVRAYRGTVFKAAKFGRMLEYNEKADTFMSMEVIADGAAWTMACDNFFKHVDELPLHYVLHLAHGAQILGYKHPHAILRSAWHFFYERVVDDMHLNIETQEQMDERLSDWGRRHW